MALSVGSVGKETPWTLPYILAIGVTFQCSQDALQAGTEDTLELKKGERIMVVSGVIIRIISLASKNNTLILFPISYYQWRKFTLFPHWQWQS